jgi:flagellar biosynthetic protein FliP
MKRRETIKYLTTIVGLILVINFFAPYTVFANANIAPISPINISIGNGGANQGTATTLQLLFAITIISLAPSILLMMTCFTRIIIVLHFLRSGIGTQQMPPNQILIGLALFLTFFLMAPNLQKINENALKPLSEGTITQEVAIKNAMDPFREFMLRQVEDKDLGLFTELSGNTSYASIEEIPNSVLIPSFVLGELKKGFIIGFLIYIPFIVIDMVVSSTLMAMGMMMLPPSMISLPFKVLFFIMVDGWGLVVENLIKTFR